jgi:hypothetical protein
MQNICIIKELELMEFFTLVIYELFFKVMEVKLKTLVYLGFVFFKLKSMNKMMDLI